MKSLFKKELSVSQQLFYDEVKILRVTIENVITNN